MDDRQSYNTFDIPPHARVHESNGLVASVMAAANSDLVFRDHNAKEFPFQAVRMRPRRIAKRWQTIFNCISEARKLPKNITSVKTQI